MIRDENNLPELLKRIERVMNTSFEIGVLQDGEGGKKHSDDEPITVLHIANIHEFGHKPSGIPSRSFVRKTFDTKENDIGDEVEKAVMLYLEDKISYDSAMDMIGTKLVDFVKRTLVDLKTPPNHPLTIARKKSSNPLIDTGRLLDSIEYKVVGG